MSCGPICSSVQRLTRPKRMGDQHELASLLAVRRRGVASDRGRGLVRGRYGFEGYGVSLCGRSSTAPPLGKIRR